MASASVSSSIVSLSTPMPTSPYDKHYLRLYFPATKQLLPCLVNLQAAVPGPGGSPNMFLNLHLKSVRSSALNMYRALFDVAAKRKAVAFNSRPPRDPAKPMEKNAWLSVKILQMDIKAIYICPQDFTLVIFNQLKIVYRPDDNPAMAAREEANVKFWMQLTNVLAASQFKLVPPEMSFSSRLQTVAVSSPVKDQLASMMASQYDRRYYCVESGRRAQLLEYLVDWRQVQITLAHAILANENDPAKSQLKDAFQKLHSEYIAKLEQLFKGREGVIVPWLDPFWKHPESSKDTLKEGDGDSLLLFYDSLQNKWSPVELTVTGEKLQVKDISIQEGVLIAEIGKKDIHFRRYYAATAFQTMTLYRFKYASSAYYQFKFINRKNYETVKKQIADLFGNDNEPVYLNEQKSKLPKVIDLLNQDFQQQQQQKQVGQSPGASPEIPVVHQPSIEPLSVNKLNTFLTSVEPSCSWPTYVTTKERHSANDIQLGGTQALIALDCKRLLRRILDKLAVDLVSEVKPSGSYQVRMNNYQLLVKRMKFYYGDGVPLRWDAQKKTRAHLEGRYAPFEAPI